MRREVVLVAFAAWFCCCLFFVEGDRKRFDGYTLVELQLASLEQVQVIERLGLDVWSHESRLVVGSNHILLPPGHVQLLEHLVSAPMKMLIKDVQVLIDTQHANNITTNEDSLQDGFSNEFHSYEEIVHETQRLAEAHESIATFIPSIGTSIQERNLVAILIHGGPSKVENGELPASLPKVFFMGGQHAREWISPATVMFMMNKLLTSYGKDTQVTDLLNRVAVVIVPVANPDGYDYTWTNNRLWRKNRRPNSGGSYGVDLNRNWDTHWCGSGSSKTPSSDTYCGTAPFSEPETQAVSTFVKGLGNVVASIDWHAYGQMILRPFGWTNKPPPNNKELTTLGAKMKDAINSLHGKSYTNEGSYELYYTTGSADDWIYEALHTNLSYTIELRDTGKYGFVLPASEIKPTGQEAWEAVLVFLEDVLSKYFIN